MTGSATIDNGIVYTGVSSKTEHTKVTPTFRGSVVALDARTGKILWKTYMVPEGFNGGAVWMSQPVVDHETGMLYVTTGNSYSVPNGYCVNPGQTNCTALPPDAHIDSVVALSLTTGKVAWAHHTLSADTWTMSDPNASPDFDFGAGPNLYTTTIQGKKTDVLGAGQKNGMYYALDPATGKLIWETQAGPGGVPRRHRVGHRHRRGANLRRHHQRQPQDVHLHDLRRAKEDHDGRPMDGARRSHRQDNLADRRPGESRVHHGRLCLQR